MGATCRRSESKLSWELSNPAAPAAPVFPVYKEATQAYAVHGPWLAARRMGPRFWLFFLCRFCMVYSEVPNFSEPNPEYNAQQAPNKSVSPPRPDSREKRQIRPTSMSLRGSEYLTCAFRCRTTAALLPLKPPQDPLPPLQVGEAISFLLLSPLSSPFSTAWKDAFPLSLYKCLSFQDVPSTQSFLHPHFYTFCKSQGFQPLT